MKLDIGCGLRPMRDKDWDTLDKRSEIPMFDHSVYHPNIVCDVTIERIPRPDEYYSEVRISSVLEHFTKEQAEFVLMESYRVLEHRGFIWISVPDMYSIASSLLKATDDKKIEYLINLVYGEQDYLENIHKWGYTERSLRQMMESFGFKHIVRLESEQYFDELVLEGKK